MGLTLSWQDWVLTIGNAILLLAMLPTVWKNAVVPLSTSIPTAISLAAFCVCYLSLGLWSASIASGISAGLWFILVVNHPELNKKR